MALAAGHPRGAGIHPLILSCTCSHPTPLPARPPIPSSSQKPFSLGCRDPPVSCFPLSPHLPPLDMASLLSFVPLCRLSLPW